MAAYALPSANFSLILASDGLWDVVTPKEVGGILHTVPTATWDVTRPNQPYQPEDKAAALRDEAFLRGSADNITVAVVSAALSAMR